MSETLPLRHGPVEIRRASTMEVRFPERQIDLVAVPYDEPAEVIVRGRMVTESFAPGAFEGVQMRARQFVVNRAHDYERPLGKVRRFRPRDERGLVAEIEVARIGAGDEALELAAEGLLGASVGYGIIPPDGEIWSDQGRTRRIVKAWLDHIALTGEPAFAGAQVLAVRNRDEAEATVASATTATPNLDQVRAWRLEERYSRL